MRSQNPTEHDPEKIALVGSASSSVYSIDISQNASKPMHSVIPDHISRTGKYTVSASDKSLLQFSFLSS